MTDTCTPEHCSQADVCMCWRTHTPTTCPARMTESLRRGLQQAHDGLAVRRDDLADYEAEAEQRYRTQAGMDLPAEQRARKARENAANTTPLRHKTW